MTTATRYDARGVSSQKEDIHAAINTIDSGLFPTAFCKIVEDHLGQDPEFCVVMHADGAGTKSSLAYLYYRETGDLSVFSGIAQDALVMNIDDLLCVGACTPILCSSGIGRNRRYIDGKVIQTLIASNEALAKQFTELGVSITTTGGETADVGDLVRTLIVDMTVTTRLAREDVIANDQIKAGDIIIGLASSGQTTYESTYNSGIGSNGLTSARHELLNSYYKEKYPESCDPGIPDDLCYNGPFRLEDPLEGTPLNIGQALLSPTRSYAPILHELLSTHRNQISALIHCSGGGQSKCLRFGSGIHYVKNKLFPIPPVFETIHSVSGTDWKEMYQVFNMGHRMEIIADASLLPVVQEIAKKFNCDCQQIGVCEASTDPSKNKLTINNNDLSLEWEHSLNS